MSRSSYALRRTAPGLVVGLLLGHGVDALPVQDAVEQVLKLFGLEGPGLVRVELVKDLLHHDNVPDRDPHLPRKAVELCSLAADAVSQLTDNNAELGLALAEAGAINPLVAMLGSTSLAMQATAAGAIGGLSSKNVRRTAV